jgi:tRNA(Leu) C34 or U34 (ribose-2'-O)-methylase TrmL
MSPHFGLVCTGSHQQVHDRTGYHTTVQYSGDSPHAYASQVVCPMWFTCVACALQLPGPDSTSRLLSQPHHVLAVACAEFSYQSGDWLLFGAETTGLPLQGGAHSGAVTAPQ